MKQEELEILYNIPVHILIKCLQKLTNPENFIENELNNPENQIVKHSEIEDEREEYDPYYESLPDYIKNSNVKLRDYQIKGIQHILKKDNNGLFLNLRPGYGKTLIAVAASQGFISQNDSARIVVILPKSLIGNFKKEIIKYGSTVTHHYEFYTFSKAMHMKKARDPIYSDKNTFLIIDEVHNLRTFWTAAAKKKPSPESGQGKQYSAAMDVAEQAGKILILSATPFVNFITDLTSIVNFLHRKRILGIMSNTRLPKTDIDYAEEYIKKSSQGHITGHNKLILDKYLTGNVLALPYKEDTVNFPKVLRKQIIVYMSPEYEKLYVRIMASEKVGKIQFAMPKPFYNGARRAVNKVNDSSGTDDFTMKLNAAKDVILNKGKCLIYTNWIEFGLDPIIRFLKKHDITAGVISGEVDVDTRTKRIQQYNDNELQVMVITRAGGEGIDLMETRSIIILDPTWNPSTLHQIEGRGIRFKSHINLPPSERNVTIYNCILLARGKNVETGDLALYTIVAGKMETMKIIDRYLLTKSILLEPVLPDENGLPYDRRNTRRPNSYTSERVPTTTLYDPYAQAFDVD